MRIPVCYYAPSQTTNPTLVHVRLLTKVGVADEALDRYGLAGAVSAEPKIIFLLSEYVPVTGAVVSFETIEAYRITGLDPSDDITITATCVRLALTDALKYAPPSDTAV